MFIDEEVDPASLPQKDGKPVKPGDEIENCGTCGYCRLRIDDADKPYAVCTSKRIPGQWLPIYSVRPNDPPCDKWHEGFQPYEEQLWFWRWSRRCENDPDCQVERKKELELEAQDHAESLKEDRQRGIRPRIPKLGGRYDRG